MPTYDFQCPTCGTVFEQKKSFAHLDEPTYCPQDGAEAQRLFSSSATIFSGNHAGNPIASVGQVDAHGHGHTHGPGGHHH